MNKIVISNMKPESFVAKQHKYNNMYYDYKIPAILKIYPNLFQLKTTILREIFVTQTFLHDLRI